MKPLTGKLILLAVTGSIAAVETVKLVHALRRRGAEVQAVMSDAATRIIHPDALTYACGRETLTRISGMVEHVTYCGDDHSASLLLIAPCTANTLSKIACGIDDTPVTTFATTALGSQLPVVIVPAMHHAMFRHIGVMENVSRLSKWGISIVNPRIEEGKAKIADIPEIVLQCERELSGKPLAGKRVIITSGRCEEPVDDVRVLTTRSSGKMGQELAKEAFRQGADVLIIHRHNLPGVKNISIDTAESMLHVVNHALSDRKNDIYISAAAISDYAPVRYPGKIPSGENPQISLIPLPKVLDAAIGKAGITVAFKLGEDSCNAALDLLQKGVSLVAANAPDNMGTEEGSYMFIDATGSMRVSGLKEDIAYYLIKRIIDKHLPVIDVLKPLQEQDRAEITR
jgi:phosphopantothenoylcysteine decarboxylase/phosphopantothenate--cysteine ligase